MCVGGAQPEREGVQAAIKEAPTAVRAKLRAEVLAGKHRTKAKVKNRARELIYKAAVESATKKGKDKPDLIFVITQWTEFIQGWTKQLEEAAPYADYIDQAPTVAGSFRKAVRHLIANLEKFLK